MKNMIEQKQTLQKLLAGGAAAALIVGAVTMPMAVNAADVSDDTVAPAGAEATITVRVERNDIRISRVNDQKYSATSSDEKYSVGDIVSTYTRKNRIAFRTQKDGYVRITDANGKVLWQGEAKGGQLTTAEFNLGDVQPGNYTLTVRVYGSKDKLKGGYTEATVRLRLLATVPSILPGNTGANFNIVVGDHIISVATIVIVLALLIVLAVLISQRKEYKKSLAYSKKKKAVKRAKAKAKKRPAELA